MRTSPDSDYVSRLLNGTPREPALRQHPEDPEFVVFTYSDGAKGNVHRSALYMIPKLEEIHNDVLRQAREHGILADVHQEIHHHQN
jgi:hypothetical protein